MSAEQDPFQYSFPVIERQVGRDLINQRAKDGYINATAMCKVAGRPWNRYWDTQPTRNFANALSSETGIPVSELIQSLRGGNPKLQGTWVHPQVAIHLAQWLSPEFAVRVTQWVFEWLSGDQVVERMPYHLRRYVANMGKIPKTHFSMLQELTYNLVAPMEGRGYRLPENMVPDISEGRMFSAWLRKEKGIEPSEFPTYIHEYEDGRRVEARLYPNYLLADFRKHFNEVWLPERAESYFSSRDKKALPYLKRLAITHEPA